MIMMAYGYSIKKRNGKKASGKTRKMEPRWLFASLAMAAGIFAAPFGIAEAATEIIRKDGTAITAAGNVYNITPEWENADSKFAYNRFQQFALESGHIANLDFGSADTLANLVQKKIDINGIVNGIKNGQIDGHLMFLSPEGIAVGATGVINAGQFTGIVPTRTAFDTLYGTATENPAITLDQINDLLDKSKSTYAITDKNGNAVGIDVKGQINTHSGVMLGAGVININDGAKLQSVKNIDFTNLVNTGSANAGLNSLTASAGTGGDIVLAAKQTSDVKDTKTENNAQVPNAIRWRDRSTDLNAAVNIGKNVEITSSDKAVKLTATSTSTYEDSTPMTLTNTLRDAIFGSGETMLDGVIDKLASKEGSANKYLFVNYSNKKNKSAVNIGEGSTITGKNIDIAATSTVQIKQSVAVPSSGKDSEGKTVDNTSAMPVAAVAISRVYNNADVVIDGNLTATGADAEGSGIKISANADTKAELSATAAGGANTSAAVGVAVLSGDTKSKVTVNAPTNAAALTADKGKVSVDATTKSDVDVKVNAVGTNSYVVSNVGVANYDTNADVIVNRSINAGAVDVKAENAVSKLKMTVDNTKASGENQGKNTAEANDGEKAQDEAAANAEKNKPDSEKSEDEKNSEKKSIDPTKVLKDANVDTNDNKTKDAAGTDGKGGVQDVKDKIEGTNNGGDNGKQNSAFGLGASVGVVSNTNSANVTIGKNAVITASKPDGAPEAVDGSVKVNADTLMTASADKEDVLHFTVKNTQANANAEIGAAVLVSNVKNDATVLMDGDGTKSAQITGTGAVSLDAKAGMGTYKVTQKKKDENGNELQETEEVDKTSTLTYTVSAEGTAENDTPSRFTLDGSVGVNTLKNNAIVLLGQNGKVEGSTVKLASDATTNAEGTYGATEENDKVGIGATVGLQNIRGNALVMAGKGAEIKGTDSLEASAGNTMDLKNQVKNAGKGESVGVSGMVALSYGDSNSIVSLDDEANITAGFATITSTNSTNIDNSARSESTGQNGAKAFGIGVGIVNYDVNSLAMVADNGKGITAPSAGTTDAEKAAKKIYEDAALAQKIAGDTLAGKLGDKTAVGAKGGITTADLDLSATTTGMLKNDAKAKAVSSSQDDGDENSRKDSEKWTNWSKQGKSGADEARTDARNLEQDNVTSQNGSAAPSASGAAQEAGSAANPDETPTAPPDNAAPAAGSSGSAGASIGMEGSAALTFLGGRTDAVLDNVTVKSGTDPASLAGLVDSISVDVSATDFLGSITLGGTTTKNSLKEGGSATKVGIGGTFAMNSTNRDVDSFVRNSDIQKAGFLSNSASKIGIEVAAGMGLSTGAGNGANVNGAGVVYYNKAKQDVHALLINNTVTSDFLGNVLGLGMLSNEAVSTDFQIAGGLAATSGSGSGTNVGVGGAVAVSRLENDLASGVIGGSYTNFATIDVEAQKGTTQINGAAAGAKSGYGFNGAFAYGSTKNKTHAYISDNATVGGVLTGEVNVKAGEVPVVKTQETLDQENTQLSSDKTKVENNSILTTNAKKRLKNSLTEDVNASKKNAEQAGANKTTLTDAGIDPTGKDYLVDGSEESSLDNAAAGTDAGAAADEAAGDENEAKGLLGQNHSVTITAAMAGGLSSDVGAGAGIAYNYVKNDIAADIKDSTITADSINGEASSDSLIVSVGAGVAVGGKTFNGAGSGSWNDLKNDTKVTFADNTINGNKISAQADNASSIINIAGEVAGGKGMAMGLSLAYNSLNNTTGAYLTGNDIDMKNLTGLLEDSNSVKLASSNTGKALAVAGGVDVSIDQSNVGAVGTVAINR
ncbi:MAG: leukotoxin LktA family filamentous adhesin, partial [Schwartzia sp.]|nr:leukotoxin LktA family filamentous adhesin [Schwartzia sp. (in: firmicutes)]